MLLFALFSATQRGSIAAHDAWRGKSCQTGRSSGRRGVVGGGQSLVPGIDDDACRIRMNKTPTAVAGEWIGERLAQIAGAIGFEQILHRHRKASILAVKQKNGPGVLVAPEDGFLLALTLAKLIGAGQSGRERDQQHRHHNHHHKQSVAARPVTAFRRLYISRDVISGMAIQPGDWMIHLRFQSWRV